MMNESVVAPADCGVQGHITTLDEPAPKSMEVRSSSFPFTSKAMGKLLAFTFPKLKKDVVSCTGSPTCGMPTFMEKVSGTTLGSGRKSLTP